MRKIWMFTLCFISLVSSSMVVNSHEGETFSTMTQQEVLSEQSTELLIIDVRTPQEFAAGHVPNAINIPVAMIQEGKFDFNNESKKIVVYCRSGRRAQAALNELHDAGFDNLFHLEGDMSAWEAEGLPIEMPTSSQ